MVVAQVFGCKKVYLFVSIMSIFFKAYLLRYGKAYYNDHKILKHHTVLLDSEKFQTTNQIKICNSLSYHS